MPRALIDAARDPRAACPSPRAEAPLPPGQRLDRRPPRRGAATALPRRTRPSRSPCRQRPQAQARLSAGPPSHNARPGLPPDCLARARPRPTPSLTGSIDARDTRPRGTAGRSSGRALLPRTGDAQRRRVARTTSRRSRDSAARPPAVRCPSRSVHSTSSEIEASSRFTCSITSLNRPLRRASASRRDAIATARRRRRAGGALSTWDSASVS